MSFRGWISRPITILTRVYDIGGSLNAASLGKWYKQMDIRTPVMFEVDIWAVDAC